MAIKEEVRCWSMKSNEVCIGKTGWMDGWMDGPNMTFNQKTNDPVLCETKRYCYLNFMTG